MNREKLVVTLLLKFLSFADIQTGFSQEYGTDLSNPDKRFRGDSIALVKVENVLRINPLHMESCILASQLASNLGGTSENLQLRMMYIKKSIQYARQSIQIQPNSKEAHLNYIIGLGLLSGIAKSPSEKLRHANTIKREADLLLSIDSLYPAAHFALGKWHLSLGSLTWFERAACDYLFGGMPEEASLETALRCFDRAIQLKPDCILFHYNKALTLLKLGHSDQAIKTLEYGLQLPAQDQNDDIRKNSCVTLLNQLVHKPSRL